MPTRVARRNRGAGRLNGLLLKIEQGPPDRKPSSQRVPVAGTSLPQKMLGGDATVSVKSSQHKAASPPIPIRRGTAVQFNWKLS
jgi:hypothetical protein